MTSPIVLVIGCAGATYLFFSALLHFTQDNKEPPLLETSVPFISPVFGLVSGTSKYFIKLSLYLQPNRDKYKLPIYTLRVPGQRLYVINSLSLIQPVQRQIKTIAFAPIEAQAAKGVMGVGPAGNAIIGSDQMFEDDSYLSTFVPSTHPALSPGPGLDSINGDASNFLAKSLADCSAGGPKRVELFAFVRRQLFLATTEAIYGPKNPLRDPGLEQAWYDFEIGIMAHMLNAWPSLLARKSLHAREKLLIPAFEKYFAANSHLEGSLLAQCRYNHNTGHGLRGRDLAATEVGQMVASLTNTLPSAFWLVYRIFSDSVVLNECRAEVEKLVKIENGQRTVDLAQVRLSCPTLLSTWQETLRYEHIGIAARVVMKDVMLDNTYLLKKGATVMTAAPVQHSDPSLWGSTVGEFDHRRFIPRPGVKRTSPAAFRSFGGGTVLCPGRHFASTEAMVLVALMLLRFDVKPATAIGNWEEPRKNFPMTSSIPTPKDEVWVDIVPKDKHGWRVDFSATSKGVDMVVEDALPGRA
ncbi:unnamed protein product [Clonostachys rosea]|uniref:Cytochrome P450 n=1 Tax=Bionectria ochroleuca TaxID=29856 RepID=A0ABY6UWC1_BIOOC|nr:unnamed protein product [Clonostachys rosea]